MSDQARQRFYIDIDDTLADFRSYALSRGIPPWDGTWYAADPATWTDEQRAIQQATNDLMARPDFWPHLPVMAGAFEILSAAALRGDVWLLTAYPRACANKAMVLRQKIEWAVEALQFPAARVIVCDRALKSAYARTNDAASILIDDAQQNCDEWAGAGGVAILHQPRSRAGLGATIRAIVSASSVSVPTR